MRIRASPTATTRLDAAAAADLRLIAADLARVASALGDFLAGRPLETTAVSGAPKPASPHTGRRARDDALLALAELFPGRRAAKISNLQKVLSRYAVTRWRTEQFLTTPPRDCTGTDELLFHIFRAGNGRGPRSRTHVYRLLPAERPSHLSARNGTKTRS